MTLVTYVLVGVTLTSLCLWLCVLCAVCVLCVCCACMCRGCAAACCAWCLCVRVYVAVCGGGGGAWLGAGCCGVALRCVGLRCVAW